MSVLGLAVWARRIWAIKGILGFGLVVCLTSALLPVLSGSMPAWARERARMADEFVDSIGVVTHLPYIDTPYREFDRLKEKLKRLGVRHIRDGIAAGDRQAITKLKELASIGIGSTLIVAPTSYRPDDVVQSALELGDGLDAIEGPNELDINPHVSYQGVGFPSGLREFQRDVYQAIKNNPLTADLPVWGPSLAHARNASQAGGFADRADVATMHPYPGGGPPTEGLDGYNIPRYRLYMYRHTPLGATETGYHNAVEKAHVGHLPVSEEAAGKYMPRLLLEYFNRGFVRTFIYQLHDQMKPDLKEQEANFGLVRYDWSEKPAYTAVRNLIRILEDPGADFLPASLDYSLTGAISNVRHTLLQKQDGRFYLILWQDVSVYDRTRRQDVENRRVLVTLNLTQPMNRARTFLPSVSEEVQAVYERPSSIELLVPDHVLVVELEPQKRPGPVDLVVSDLTWEPAQPEVGDEVKFLVSVENRGSAEVSADSNVRVRFDVNGQAVAWSQPLGQSLKPGEKVDLGSEKAWSTYWGRDYTVVAYVNDNYSVPETNLANNSCSKRLTVVDQEPPPPVTDLEVKAVGSNSVSLSWYGPLANGRDFDGYKVYRNGTYVALVRWTHKFGHEKGRI